MEYVFGAALIGVVVWCLLTAFRAARKTPKDDCSRLRCMVDGLIADYEEYKREQR